MLFVLFAPALTSWIAATSMPQHVRSAVAMAISPTVYDGADMDIAVLHQKVRHLERAKDIASVVSEMAVIDSHSKVQELVTALRRSELAKDAAPVLAEMQLISAQRENHRLEVALHESEQRAAADSTAAAAAAIELAQLRAENDKLLTAVRHASPDAKGLSFAHHLAICVAHGRKATAALKAEALWTVIRARMAYKQVVVSLSLRWLVYKVRAGMCAKQLMTRWREARRPEPLASDLVVDVCRAL